MSLVSAMPSVCSAIGSSKFDELAGVTRTALAGPSNGANAYFTFSLERIQFSEPSLVQARSPVVERVHLQPSKRINLEEAVVLVSCVKSKLSHSAPARTLYTSAWFRNVRDLVEQRGAQWFILSALYGLVAPDVEIAPYDHTLNGLGVAARKEWANYILSKLLPILAGEKRVVMFAGLRYREFLIQPLLRSGIEVQVPMEGLRRGEQLAWLRER